jgi:hypothetical protein
MSPENVEAIQPRRARPRATLPSLCGRRCDEAVEAHHCVPDNFAHSHTPSCVVYLKLTGITSGTHRRTGACTRREAAEGLPSPLLPRARTRSGRTIHSRPTQRSSVVVSAPRLVRMLGPRWHSWAVGCSDLALSRGGRAGGGGRRLGIALRHEARVEHSDAGDNLRQPYIGALVRKAENKR